MSQNKLVNLVPIFWEKGKICLILAVVGFPFFPLPQRVDNFLHNLWWSAIGEDRLQTGPFQGEPFTLYPIIPLGGTIQYGTRPAISKGLPLEIRKGLENHFFLSFIYSQNGLGSYDAMWRKGNFSSHVRFFLNVDQKNIDDSQK